MPENGMRIATQTARDRLRVFMKENPGATMAYAADQLGVSRQRVYQIVREEGLVFQTKYSLDPEGVGSHAISPKELRLLRQDAHRWNTLVQYIRLLDKKPR